MKINKEQLAIIEDRMLAVAHIDVVKASADAYQDKGFSFTRFVWDWFWASKTRIGDGIGMSSNCGLVIEGCHDSHIETAITKIANKHGIAF